MLPLIDPHGQAEALKSARKHKGWSQRRLAAALEQAARALGQLSDLPPAGRQTLIQYISYFENGKRPVPDRLWPIFREALQCTDEDLGFAGATAPFGGTRLPDLPAAHLQSSGSAVISSLRRILSTNIQADSQIGPAYLISGIQAQLPVVGQVCRVTRGTDHEDALRLASQFTEFCGWLYQDAGDYRCAMYWTDRALEYAVELDDPRVLSYVLMRKSNIATDAGQPGHGLGLAHAALKQHHRLTPRLRAVALRQRANAHAMLHESADFAQNTEEAFIQATAGMRQDEDDIAPYCTPSYVEMEAGASWLRLGTAGSAVPVFEDSRARWSAAGQVRDHALCLARLATAYATTGEQEQACTVTGELITIANGLGSARVAGQVADLRRSLSLWRYDSSVADLLHKLETFQAPMYAGSTGG
jgi:transcriptional regulator with XRE-family HTH domain